MNIAALLAGDVLGEAGMKVASSVLKNVLKNNSSFSSLLNNFGSNSQAISIEDMNLSPKEELELAKIREIAMNKGLTEITIEVDGSKFNLNVKDNTLTALVS